jgi:inorganic pyrophosphatase
MLPDFVVTVIVVVGCILGFGISILYALDTAKIKLDGQDAKDDAALLGEAAVDQKALDNVIKISGYISDGADAFLMAEYKIMFYFIVLFSGVLLVLLGFGNSWDSAIFTTIAFNCGAFASILSGYIGMKIAVFSNSRTALMAQQGLAPAFNTAFKAGMVMGFSLNALGLIVLFILIQCFRLYYTDAMVSPSVTQTMYEAIAGYGLGGSSIALFGRVGGGIYTKAADVGADLCKIEHKMNEDSPKNPAVIADNVGDNVGDVAGMGADLFGSFAESSCAAMVIAAQSPDLFNNYLVLSFPLVITACGIVVCLITSFVATHINKVNTEDKIEPTLKRQLLVSTILMTPVIFLLTWFFFPDTPFAVSTKTNVKNWHIFLCVTSGLWSGLIIGYITEYYTSHSYSPVRDVANACSTGAATTIIYGLALGYKSVIIPVFALAGTIYVSYTCAGMYGIACAALGILSTLAIGLTIDVYGPICDNAGGIAEMAGMGAHIRKRTDALDAAGNTTAAIGKGFAIGSAALVSLALFGGYVTIVKLETVDILQPFQFAGLLVGAMLPYWFSAMTMKSVGHAALDMVMEVRNQFLNNPELLDENSDAMPNHQACVAISTAASLREMIPPGALVMCTPIIVGFLFGVEALAGVLAGSLVSGVQMAISASNTGGAWDNAKKYIEADEKKEKGGPEHRAAVIGDTVGDPLKDTSGPALNILIKLSAIISLVLGSSFPSQAKGGLLVQLFS